ncbi:hypothetical protein [Lacisediminihabitans profunda]|nr:hypothetical protein [Lacisediminihabitans profunda]
MTEMSLRAVRPRLVSPAEDPMLDLVYVVGAVGLFALVALVARGVEKL